MKILNKIKDGKKIAVSLNELKLKNTLDNGQAF